MTLDKSERDAFISHLLSFSVVDVVDLTCSGHFAFRNMVVSVARSSSLLRAWPSLRHFNAGKNFGRNNFVSEFNGFSNFETINRMRTLLLSVISGKLLCDTERQIAYLWVIQVCDTRWLINLCAIWGYVLTWITLTTNWSSSQTNKWHVEHIIRFIMFKYIILSERNETKF